LSLGDHRFQAKDTEDFQELPFHFLGKDLNKKIAEMTRRRVSREESQGSANMWNGPSCRQDPPRANGSSLALPDGKGISSEACFLQKSTIQKSSGFRAGKIGSIDFIQISSWCAV
jgi:hypothetical protein